MPSSAQAPRRWKNWPFAPRAGIIRASAVSTRRETKQDTGGSPLLRGQATRRRWRQLIANRRRQT
jgi:hypothetical protein